MAVDRDCLACSVFIYSLEHGLNFDMNYKQLVLGEMFYILSENGFN